VKTYIGADNGISGNWCILGDKTEIFMIPTFTQQSYTSRKQNITRVDTNKLKEILKPYSGGKDVLIVLELPFVNSKMFKTSLSAIRALEATLIVIENLGIPYMYISAKKWQHDLLPAGLKGRAEQKKASLDVGCRLFPTHKEEIIKHKDADGALIALWAKRMGL
jgi:hypothetical protein